jgi:Zn-dependent protease with chaperone function
MMKRRFAPWLAVMLAFAVAVPDLAQGQIFYSREQEIQAGRQAAAEIEKQIPVLDEGHPVSRYVQSLGERLAANTPEPRYDYVFKVVNQKEINAFALPGGPVYINLGVIRAADNEAQVVGVMGHEIAHVVMRHGAQQASRGALAQLGGAILGGVIGGGGGQLAQLGVGLAGGVVMMKYSRGAEREADRVGARILYETGYNPQAMVDFFQKLQQQGGRGGPEWLSSHPDPGNRAAGVRAAISGLPRKSYRQNSADYAEIKETALAMTPQSAQEVAERQQAQSGTMADVAHPEVTPSGEMRRFEHSQFLISHPSNWEVFGDRNSGITIAPRAGIAANAIAYGVMINVFQPRERSSLDAAVKELVQGISQSNPQVRAVGGASKISVNRVAGRSVELIGPSPVAGQRERDWLVALDRGDGTLLYAVFVAPERDFDGLRPTFQNMLRSLRLY